MEEMASARDGSAGSSRARRQRTTELSTLALRSTLDLPTVLESIADSAQALVGASDCLIYLYDEVSQGFSLGSARGRWAEQEAVVGPRPDGLTATVAREVRPVIIDRATDHPLYASPEAQAWNIEAIAGFPLEWAGRVLGVLHVIFIQPHTFSPEEQRALEALAGQAAGAIANARLHEATRTQLEELKVLHAVATAGAEAAEEDELIERVTRIIGETLYPADIFGVMLLDAEAGLLQIHPTYQVSEEFERLWQAGMERLGIDDGFELVMPLGEGITGTVAASGKPCRAGDVTRLPHYIDAGIGTRSELCVPITVGDRIIGVINAESRQPDAFSEADERLLATVAGQLATAIERVRLYEAAQQEIAERKQAEEELRRLTDFNEGIIQNMAEGIFVLDAGGCFTFVNPAASTMLGYEPGELVGLHWTTVVPVDQRAAVSATDELRARGESNRYEVQLVRKDGTRIPIQVTGSPRLDPETGELFGTMGVFVDLTERVRVEEELHRHRDNLEELVEERTTDLAKSNIQLLREIEERRRAEAERERLLAVERAQARRQDALLRLSAELAATLDEAEVSRRVVNGLHGTLGYDSVTLFLVDEATGDRVHVASAGPVQPLGRLKQGQGLSERPLLDGRLHYTPDVSQEPSYIHWMGGSEVDVPIRIGGELQGVLVAEGGQINAFSEHDLEVLMAAAQQAGLAIDNARLYAQAERRAVQAALVFEVGRRVSGELDLETLLSEIVTVVCDAFDYYGVLLLLLDEQAGTLALEAIAGGYVGLIPQGYQMPRGQGMTGHAAATGETQISGDVSRDPYYIRVADEGTRSELSVPLKSGRKVVGVLDLQSVELDAFDQTDVLLMETLADQIAVAIENARLYGETERRVVELATLTDIGQALSSTLRVDEVVQLIYEQTRRVMYAENMLILLYDQESHEIECAFSTESDKLAPGARWPADTALTGSIIDQREPILLGDAPEDLAALARELEGMQLGQQQVSSYMGVPMLRGDRVLGVIKVMHYTAHNVYDESDKVLLQTIANQAAIAIENARLYDQAQQEIAERMRAEEELRTYHERLEELVQERTAELRASEARYRTLFDGVPVGLYRSTPAGKVVDANQALVQMLGFEDRESFLAIAEAAGLYVEPETRVRWQALMEREGILRDFEYQQRRRDGTVIWVKDTARAVMDGQGQVLYYEGSIEDITERKRAEDELRKYQEGLEDLVEARTAELRESEERYRTLFDGVPVGLYRVTPEGQVLEVNMGVLQMLGYPNREAWLEVMRTGDIYVDPQVRVSWQALMEREGVVRDFEFEGRRLDGTHLWISDTARAVKDEEGCVLYYEGSLEDISERKRIEEELRRQKEYYEALFVNSPVAVATTDLDTNVVSWNPEAERLFGYSGDEVIGRNLDDLVASDPRVREHAHMLTAQVTKGRVQATTKRVRKDGSLADVEALALPVIVGDRKVGYIGIYVDIADLQQARREAETASQAKSTFLANMSHELRTPLNAIMGFTRLVKRRSGDVLPEKQLDNLDKVLTSADHLLELINAILDLSKIEAGRTEVQPATFRLDPLVDVCLQTVRPLIRAEQIELVKEVDPDLPPLLTDQDKVRQILINLLSNAVKFTEAGTISVSAWRRRDLLSLEVSDTGIGIPEEALDRVFEPFQQVDSGTTRRYGGTGLGLSISRHLSQLLGGDLTVESTVGVGSTFTVTIPIRYGGGSLAPARTAGGERPAAPAAAGPDEGPLVLVIDDDPNVIILLQENLADAGYRVVGATAGAEGLAKARELQPAAILLDILMSPKDGWQVLHDLKSDEDTQDIPVVVLSIVENRELGYRLGASDYLLKPFDRETILRALSRLVPSREEERPVDLLVVDDDPQVIDLVRQLLEGEPYAVRSAADGVEALDAVAGQCPDIMLLDLLMPRLDGFGVITRLQRDAQYRDLPIIILTAKTLSAEELSQLQQRLIRVVQKRALDREVLVRELRSALRVYRDARHSKG